MPRCRASLRPTRASSSRERGPITAKHRVGAGDVGERCTRASAGCRGAASRASRVACAVPVTIRNSVVGEPRDGDVALVGAARVQHAGIDRCARPAPRRRWRRAAAARPRHPALHQELGERGQVERSRHASRAACVLGRAPREPVLPVPAIVDLALLALAARRQFGRSQPILLPNQTRPWRRAGRNSGERRNGRAGLELAVRPRHLVVQAEHLGDAAPAASGSLPLKRGEAADVDRPEVERAARRRRSIRRAPCRRRRSWRCRSS